jgi:hypothetical protein
MINRVYLLIQPLLSDYVEFCLSDYIVAESSEKANVQIE